MTLFGPILLAALVVQGAPAQTPQAPSQSPAPATSTTPTTPAAPEPPQVTSIKVQNYGIFSAAAKPSNKPPVEGIPFTAVDNVRLKTQTRTVPLNKGVSFGFQYQAIGTPRGERASLHFVVLYPPPGISKPGVSSPISKDEYDKKVRIGVKGSFDGYQLDDDWELIPGDWTLEIWSGTTKLTSETFTLAQ